MRNTVVFRILLLWCGLLLAFCGLALRYVAAERGGAQRAASAQTLQTYPADR